MLPKDELLKLLVLLNEQDEVLEEPEHLWHRAEALHLCLEIADLVVLPVEEVASNEVPRHAVTKADGLCRGKEHLRHHYFGRLGVVPADLVDAECDRLFLASVLALNN